MASSGPEFISGTCKNSNPHRPLFRINNPSPKAKELDFQEGTILAMSNPNQQSKTIHVLPHSHFKAPSRNNPNSTHRNTIRTL
jgi:hypothetical protein